MKYMSENKVGVSIYYKNHSTYKKAVLDKYEKISLKNTEKASRTLVSLTFLFISRRKELEYLLSKIENFR